MADSAAASATAARGVGSTDADGDDSSVELVPVLVCGGGLAGLALGLGVHRLLERRRSECGGIVDFADAERRHPHTSSATSATPSPGSSSLSRSPVVVCEARSSAEAFDPTGGSGMSVIGHSLVLLRALGLDLSTALAPAPPPRVSTLSTTTSAGAEAEDAGDGDVASAGAGGGGEDKEAATGQLLASPQPDVTLRSAFVSHPSSVVFQVPTDADRELVRDFGTVQFNVHRGELHAALHARFTEGCGGDVRLGLRLVDVVELPAQKCVEARFANGTRIRTRLLVGADGVHSVARRFVLSAPPVSAAAADASSSAVLPPLSERADPSLRDSGYSCWRGMTDDTPEMAAALGGPGMFKTIISPPGRSFTCATAPGSRRFWLIDVGGEDRPRELLDDVEAEGEGRVQDADSRRRREEERGKDGRPHPQPQQQQQQQQHRRRRRRRRVAEPSREELDQAMSGGFAPELADVVRATPTSRILLTDVYDCHVSRVTRASRAGVVLIGDAAHPVVHQFGQGACMAVEDAVGLVRVLDTLLPNTVQDADTLDAALASERHSVARGYDSWGRWLRCSLIVLMSRWCGALYMSPHTWLTAPLLRVCLATPLRYLFILATTVLLLLAGFPLRTFAATRLAPPTATSTAPSSRKDKNA